MNRMMFFLILAAYVAVASLPAVAEESNRSISDTGIPKGLGKPNIVFVLFDDIGYGQPTSYRNDSPFKTPNINRLAEEGMRFTDAHSAAANCTPTR